MEYFVQKKVNVFVNLYRLGTAVNKSLGQRIIMYRSIPKPPMPPPPGQTPGHLIFLKKFGQIPRYVASLDGQILHPLEL